MATIIVGYSIRCKDEQYPRFLGISEEQVHIEWERLQEQGERPGEIIPLWEEEQPFTQDQAQALAEEIRNAYPSLPIRVTHIEAEYDYAEQNMVGLLHNDRAITVFQSHAAWEGFLALAHMICEQEAQNQMAASLDAQALEFSR